MTLITLGVYVSVSPSNVLDAEKAFVSVSLFNILKNPLSMLPQIISGLTQVTPVGLGVLLERGQVVGVTWVQGIIKESHWNQERAIQHDEELFKVE